MLAHLKKIGPIQLTPQAQTQWHLLAFGLPLLITVPIIWCYFLVNYSAHEAIKLPDAFLIGLNSLVILLSSALLLFTLIIAKPQHTLRSIWRVRILYASMWGQLLVGANEMMVQWYAFYWVGFDPTQSTIFTFKTVLLQSWAYGLLVSNILSLGLARQCFRQLARHQNNDVQETSGHFGTAAKASQQDLIKMGAYDESGSIFGKDKQGNTLRCPLKHRLILGNPGGGKSSGIIIPALLTQDCPVFVNDIKGELWAVTARHRATGFGRTRQVMAIDPFGILQHPDFAHDKSEELLKRYTLNPLNYISDDEVLRDRGINNLVQALIKEEKQSSDASVHFRESAEILLSGLIDYVLKKFKAQSEELHLVQVHDLLMVDEREMEIVLKDMLTYGGKARAGAAHVLKSKQEERSGMYTTTYRQLKWLADKALRDTFQSGNVDLRNFLTGEMDIFIIIPEDQVRFHDRVFRLLFATITGLLSQAAPSQLPEKPILFLLDELAQYGYCKDIENAIEVLRGRGAVLWTAFQSLKQIQAYQKPDLFLSMPIKQVFQLDDVPTMQWIQQLASTTTVLSASLSENKGSSVPKMQWLGGSNSRGESKSFQETRADLIPLNEIREMPLNEQLVFILGQRVIQCQRLAYYQENFLQGYFDANPYVKKQQS